MRNINDDSQKSSDFSLDVLITSGCEGTAEARSGTDHKQQVDCPCSRRILIEGHVGTVADNSDGLRNKHYSERK